MSGKRRSPELIALQEAFRLDVVFAGDPDGRPLPCFFAAYDERPCSKDRMEAAHWINRQRIKNALWAMGMEPDLIEMAEWDPRLAVPGCTNHHRPFDSHSTPRLWIYREEVPWEVEEAVAEWGLESALEDRSPFFDPRAPSDGAARPDNDEARFARFATQSERRLFGG